MIGAGAAGLCAVRNALSFGCEVIAFEQSDKIGGTWVYTDKTGEDRHGNDIHSSMYQGLRTNLPKELMSFPDFPFPPSKKSFLPASEVNDYLTRYADNFKLCEHIKFEHHVLRVRPLPRSKVWELIIINYQHGRYENITADIVLVCNGHFSVPAIPHIAGVNEFQGRQIHSHDYRTPNRFASQKVLTIGAGPSGVDISQEIASVASKVFWSNHLSPPKVVEQENIIQKPDVRKFTKTGAVFDDGSFEEFDAVVHCTGYEFTFPFLSLDCQLLCESNYVRPLFKHCLNINYPSMGLIGLPFYTCPFQMFDIQVKFCLTFMTGRKVLPSKQEMVDDTEREMERRWQSGIKKRRAHGLGKLQSEYFSSLSSLADLEPLRPVILKMYEQNRRNQVESFANYREFRFTVLNDEHFEVNLDK